ncbi:39S ribosomal protein L19, mitochondrial precursor, putative [Schistosoma mansoni]|uniref:39S ribosomal protein L19, mitochondrial precursor, putative n=1 Tax=Schistosoma mansoni TaxID=6183 RepID=UPI00022C82DA|nr:39S ribosomal protein L19, mitochondrial precursor, putative [Schistosoma mansoni]|eukprot:XP_018646407.1 39S ribosomal protein L19, mitochondrial precursor, putative [Schistosoma mansoni]
MASMFVTRVIPRVSKVPILMPCRFSRQRLPPEYRKQYLEKISNEALDKYRKSDFVAYPALKTQRLWEVQPQEPKKETKSVVAVRTADKFAPDQSHRFMGICIERFNEGLWTKFTLRNVIEKTAVEIQYELYNPTIQSIEVLLLEKRLDRNLLYLRDAPLDESRFPFDMSRIPYNPSDPVPINDKKVKLLPPPWAFKWYLHGYRGIHDSMYDYLTPQQLSEIQDKINLVDRYDLMKMYRSRLCLEEERIALGDVQIQHQDLIRHHEQRRQELIDKHKETRRTDKTTAHGGR